MEQIIVRSPAFTRARVFTSRERAYAEAHHRPAVHYAMFFAAKEAVPRRSARVPRGIIEVVTRAKRASQSRAHRRAKEVAAEFPASRSAAFAELYGHITAVQTPSLSPRESCLRVEEQANAAPGSWPPASRELRGMPRRPRVALPDALMMNPPLLDDITRNNRGPAADTPTSHAQGDADAFICPPPQRWKSLGRALVLHPAYDAKQVLRGTVGVIGGSRDFPVPPKSWTGFAAARTELATRLRHDAGGSVRRPRVPALHSRHRLPPELRGQRLAKHHRRGSGRHLEEQVLAGAPALARDDSSFRPAHALARGPARSEEV